MREDSESAGDESPAGGQLHVEPRPPAAAALSGACDALLKPTTQCAQISFAASASTEQVVPDVT